MRNVSKIVAGFLLCSAPAALIAQDVELRSSDGLLTIEGTLKSYDGRMLTVDTSYGEINIPAADVTCSGSCPDGVVRTATNRTLTISFADQPLRITLENLLRAQPIASYAQAEVTWNNGFASLVSSVNEAETADLFMLNGDAESDVSLELGNPQYVSSSQVNSASGLDSIAQTNVFEIGVRPLAVVVSLATGVESLHFDDLARIYAGDVTNWSELGGNEIPIQAIAPANEEGDFKFIEAGVLEPTGRAAASRIMRVRGDRQAAELALTLPGGIAVLPYATVSSDMVIQVQNECGVLQPSPFNIGSGAYPLVVSAYASFDTEAGGDFIPRVFDAMASSAARNVLLSEGFTDPAIVVSSDEQNSTRLSSLMSQTWPAELREPANEMANLLLSARQLSMRFHGAGQDASVANARANFVRLAEAIKRGDFDGQELLFVGYAPGTTSAAVATSFNASSEVLDAFRKFSPEAAERAEVRLTSSGLGSVGVACSAVEKRETANFVEVWVRPAL